MISLSAAEFDPIVWTGRALQAESCERQKLVLLYCIRPIGGAYCSWPSWISARVRSQSRIGPRRPVGSPDHERDGETVLPSPQTRLTDLGRKSFLPRVHYLHSHPFGATVARSTTLGERRGGEGLAAIPLVNLSKPMSCLRDLNARLVVPPFGKHTPCNAGQLVGERGGQNVVNAVAEPPRRAKDRSHALANSLVVARRRGLPA